VVTVPAKLLDWLIVKPSRIAPGATLPLAGDPLGKAADAIKQRIKAASLVQVLKEGLKRYIKFNRFC